MHNLSWTMSVHTNSCSWCLYASTTIDGLWTILSAQFYSQDLDQQMLQSFYEDATHLDHHPRLITSQSHFLGKLILVRIVPGSHGCNVNIVIVVTSRWPLQDSVRTCDIKQHLFMKFVKWRKMFHWINFTLWARTVYTPKEEIVSINGCCQTTGVIFFFS